MKIIADAFGGDNAPLEILKGCAEAKKNLGVDIVLCGSDSKIKKCAADNNIDISGMEIIHTDGVFDIHEEPSLIVKERKDCSMAVGLQALADGKGDAFVSAGSTGALVVGATFIAKRLKGIKRAALAPVMPTAKGYMMLLDVGANAECRPEMLVQFGIMGSCYAENILGIKSPKVALLNIGSEETKGRPLERDTYALLKKAPVNFTGNIEARDLPLGECDVVVADGYTGNIALKLYEGMGSFFAKTLKSMLMSGAKNKLAALLIMKEVKAFKKTMDYTEQGGAVLLGISKPVIKAHGSSNAKAFYNAIRQAKNCIEKDVIGEISKSLEIMKNDNKE